MTRAVFFVPYQGLEGYMWVLIPLGLFLLLSYVGRQARLGRLKSGPWIRQFRAARSIVSLIFLGLGLILLVRGLVWLGLGSLLASFVLGGSVRFHSYFHSTTPASSNVTAYSQEEIRAYQVLGLTIGADKRAIKEAWKQRMKLEHPDQGGSTQRASALNAARDTLLRRRR